MRDLIDIVEGVFPDDKIVDLRQHKLGRASGAYANNVQGIFSDERAFFASGKFAPFAKTYLDNDSDPKLLPTIELDVQFRDFRLGLEARHLLTDLRARKFKIISLKPNGPLATKLIDSATARSLFSDREHSVYGAYQPSRHGFRTSRVETYDARGVGFALIVGGYDGRRGDNRGNPIREEHHVIDDDADMREVSQMFALIQRARMKVL